MFRNTFYYQARPVGGSFDDPDTLSGGRGGAQIAGGDVSDPYRVNPLPPFLTSRIDRAEEIKLSDGSLVLFPAAVGTRWAIITKGMPGHSGLFETPQ